MRDVLSRVTIAPKEERVLDAYLRGREAKKRPGMTATDCPYDQPHMVLAWRYGWNGHKLPLPNTN